MTIPKRPTAAHVKAVRQKTGLTQKEFALLAAVSPMTVSHWECGHRGMSPPIWQLVLIRTGLFDKVDFFNELGYDA